MRGVQRLRRWAAAVSVAVGLVLVGQVASAAPAEYVNMGDSYSAGSGIVPPAPDAPPQCTQSALNWGHLIAARQGYHLKDVSCGGAQTKDYTTPQFPGVAPQLDALSPSTRLVTMTIGGNDNNVFSDTITRCGSAAATTAGKGNPCERMYGTSFVDTINNSTYPNLLKALAAVRAKAPKARVAISGYLQILPPTQGCYPIMPVAVGDVPYLNGIEAALNDAVRRAASNTGVTFLDMSQLSAGHDACQPIGTRWVEPVVGSTNVIAVHPNAAGEEAMADRALATMTP